MYNPFSLKGKTILVTGASSGIGRATAIESSRMGAVVYITGRNEERLAETFAKLEGEGHQQYIADLTIEAEVEQLVKVLPQLSGVVHSAGVIPECGTPSYYIENDEMIDMFRSNVLQIISLNSLLIQSKKIVANSSVVHISSYSANHPSIGLGMYCITKNALATYSKTLATELATKKIRVNTLLPGMVDSEIILKITEENQHFIKDRENYPFDYGQPEDVAWVCIYLLSDAARWVTGSELTLDGGSLLGWR